MKNKSLILEESLHYKLKLIAAIKQKSLKDTLREIIEQEIIKTKNHQNEQSTIN
jgi:hypothetical protein